MPDLILEIAEQGRFLSLSRGFAVVSDKNGELGRVPLDSLAALLLCAEDATVSKNVLARLAEENIPVIICDQKYFPVAVSTPLAPHYRPLKVFQCQNEASAVIKKQLWQSLVACKVHNQAETLAQCRPCPEVAALRELCASIRSGDTDNKEAQAAKIYWPALMGESFLRDQDGDGINAWLNYGYTVQRAAFARAVCGSGLLPMLGIKHHNTYNAFCLVDDLMEPLRPFVDRLVFANTAQVEEALRPQDKRILAGILTMPLPLAGEQSTLGYVATRMTQSYVKSLEEKTVRLLLPKL